MARTILIGTAALIASLALAGAGWGGAVPGAGSLPAGWTHAEINITIGGSPHTLVYNRGEVEAASATSLTLHESDGSVVVVPVSSATQILVNGQLGSLASVRVGATAVTLQTDGNPAQRVEAKVPARLLVPAAARRIGKHR